MDQQLLKEIFETYYSRLVLFSNRYVGQDSIAEDIVQEAFVKLWDKRAEIQDSSNESLKSYLYHTVKTKSLNFLKHTKVKQAFENDNQPEEHILPVLHTILEAELISEVHAAIDDLPSECRKVARELFIKGKKYSEVAETLQISINTVKSQRQRALTLLKPRLSEMVFVLISLYYPYVKF
ncbi:RNA polymerase sigma-70 factor [Cyclobacterium sediminis]